MDNVWVNMFEVSKRHTSQYFVDVVKDKWRTKNNNLEFLIGCRSFSDPKDDTWETLTDLSSSGNDPEHMMTVVAVVKQVEVMSILLVVSYM